MARSPYTSISESEAVMKDGTKILHPDVRKLYYEGIENILLGISDKSNPVQAHLDKAFKAMVKRDQEKGGLALKWLRDSIMELGEYRAEDTTDTGFLEYRLYKQLFPWQRKVWDNHTKRNTLLASRRAGKTSAMARIAVNHCLQGSDTINGYDKPRSVLIMGLTIQKCADQYWTNIINCIEGIPCKIDNSSYEVIFDNGASIHLTGNASKQEREKQRGMEYSLIIIDEAQSQNSLNYLMTDILGPIIRGRDSTVFIAGTGSITNKGYWKEITSSPEWTHFHALMTDNPTLPADALEGVLRENGWTEQNTTFRREYLAENIVDTSRLVYPAYHRSDTPAKIATDLIIGVDYGWSDSNAFVPILLFNDHTMHELDSVKFNHSSSSEIATQAKELYDRLAREHKIDQRRIMLVADTSDQSISREIQNMGVPITNAYKVDRNQQIRDLRRALESGTLTVSSDNVIDELEAYVWKYDEENKSVIYETDDNYYHPDCLAALRYAFYYASHL